VLACDETVDILGRWFVDLVDSDDKVEYFYTVENLVILISDRLACVEHNDK